MIELGKVGKLEVEDIMLKRYAGFLIAQISVSERS